MHPRTFWRYNWIAFYSRLVLLLFLTLICLFPVLSPQADILSRVSQQEVRSQRFAKDALLLEDHWVPDHITAISEMQNMLSPWQSEEGRLASANDDELRTLMGAITPEYISITNAVQAILAHPDQEVDPIQVGIILTNERSYLLTMNQVVTLIRGQLDLRDQLLSTLEIGLIVLVVGWFTFDRLVLWPKIQFLFLSSPSPSSSSTPTSP